MNDKSYKRKTEGRRKIDIDREYERKTMNTANLWLKIMTIILTLTLFAITWIGNAINNLQGDVSLNYTATQVTLSRLTDMSKKIEQERNDRLQEDIIAKRERDALDARINQHIAKDFQSWNDRSYQPTRK